MARPLRFADKGGAIVPYVKQTTQTADDVAGLLQGLKGKLPRGGTLAGLGVLAAGVPALLEFTDKEDPVVRNAMQAGGRFAGSLGLGAAGAAIGQALIPVPGVGAVIGGTLGGMLGDAVGGGAMGGVYDIFDDPKEEARREMEKDEALKTQILIDRLQALGPVQQKLAEMSDARAVNVARQNMNIQRDYNFGNMLDQSSLMAQQNHAQLNAIAMQQLL